MARALSNATLTAALSDGLTLLINRRGYSAAAAAAVGRPARGMPVEEKAAGKREGPAAADVAVAAAAAASSSWVPDPVTGCYRPANRLVETDAVELREMHLSHKSRG